MTKIKLHCMGESGNSYKAALPLELSGLDWEPVFFDFFKGAARDPEFRAALLQDATAAVSDLGYFGRQGEHMVAVENTPELHNMVVCTLCSCYPWPLLGIPPAWYKSDAYRARVVREPRNVLAEFGVTLPEKTAVRVWDSTAEVRYLVIPMRPEGSEDLDLDALAALVTRDSMIGTGLARAPS